MRKELLIFVFIFKFCNYSYSQQDVELYNRVINDFAIKNFNPLNSFSDQITIIALDKPTHPFNNITFQKLKETYRKLSKQTFDDFYRKNQSDARFERFSTIGFNLVVFKKDTIPSQEQLASAYPKWNQVIIELSNVGYNEVKDQAMIYYGSNIGSRAAGGFYVIYKMKKGKWKQKKIIPAWSS